MKINSITQIKLIFTVLLISSLASCGHTPAKKNLPAGVHGVEVIQVLNTTKYTYLRVSEDKTEYWMAIVREDIKSGDSVYYSQAYDMKDFYSKELDRTFPSVFFVQDPSGSPERLAATDGAQMPNTESPSRRQPVTKMDNLKVEKASGGITIEELYGNPEQFAGKKIKVRGLIGKLSKEIMKRNWMHIQDGTGNGTNFDLTVTSADIVTEGNIATFEGIIALKKDFGSGYFYEVIMEEAVPSDVERYE